MKLHSIGQKTVKLTESQLEEIKSYSEAIGYNTALEVAARQESETIQQKIGSALWTKQYLQNQIDRVLSKATNPSWFSDTANGGNFPPEAS